MGMRLVREPEKFVSPGVWVVRLPRHLTLETFPNLRPPLSRLTGVPGVLSNYLFVIIENSDFESHPNSPIPRTLCIPPGDSALTSGSGAHSSVVTAA